MATAEAERNAGYPEFGGFFSPAPVSRLRTPSPTKAGAMAWPMSFPAPVIAVPDHISPIPRKCLGNLAQGDG